ncbi:MAG: hypothetical protein ACC652_14550 [Acidimicrobiales bacterium]
MNGSPPSHRLLLGLAFATLVVAAGMWIFYRNSEDGSPEAGTSTSVAANEVTTTSEQQAQQATTTQVQTPDSVPDDEPGLGDVRVGELVAFVESTRGLSFDTLPEVVIQPEPEFRDQLGVYLARELDAQEVAESERIYRALGLSPADQDVEPLLREFLQRRTLGYYDADTVTVRVVAELGRLSESVLVRELTHALEDQYFDYDTERFEGRDDESELAFQSVVEGNAAFVELAFIAQLSESDQTEVRLAQAALAPQPPLSEAVLTALGFPYAEGSLYSSTLYSAGGNSMQDDALVRSPRTSEQISEGQIIGQEEPVSELGIPPADAAEVSRGVLGSLTLRLVMETAVPPGEARALSLQWGGDAYVSWDEATAQCVRVDIVAETEQAHVRMLAALTAAAEVRSGGAQVEVVDDAIRYTACG